MPVLFNKKTGREEFVPNELVAQAAASGEFDVPTDTSVAVTTPAGRVVEGSLSDLQTAEGTLDTTVTGSAALADRERQARIAEQHSGFVEGAKAFAQGALEGASLGGYGALKSVVDPVGAEDMAERAAARPGAAIGGQVVGGLGPALLSGGGGALAKAAALTPAGAASKVGLGIAARGGIGAAAAGFATEGALVGLGQGVHELAMASDPLTVERAASVLSSNALLGGAIGGGTGVIAKAAMKGLVRARGLVDEAGELLRARTGVAPDLANLDVAGLRGARQAELDAIEAERVQERATVANDIVAYHQDARAAKPWLATKGDKEFAETGKKLLKASKRVQNLLDNPLALAENPRPARAALQQQQTALEEVVAARPRIEAKIAGEAGSAPTGPEPAAPADPPRRFADGDTGPIREYEQSVRNGYNLSEGDQAVIHDFHRNRLSYDINDRLRAGRPLEEEQQELVDGLERILARPESRLPSGVVLSRGVRRGVAMPNVGETLTDEGYMFTSLHTKEGGAKYTRRLEDMLDKPERERGFQLEIEAPAGTPAVVLGGFESPVLLPKQLPLRVLEVNPETRVVRARVEAPPAAEFDDPFKYLPVPRAEAATVFGPMNKLATTEEARAADIWSTEDYKQIAGYLRGQQPATEFQREMKMFMPDRVLDEYAPGGGMTVKDTVAHLDNLMAKSSAPQDMTVFRGVQGDHVPEWKVGETYYDPSFQAASLDDAATKKFTTGGMKVGGVPQIGRRTLVQIEVPKGTPMADISGLAGGAEGEVLFARGSGLRVIAVSEGEDGVARVVARLEPPGAPAAAHSATATATSTPGATRLAAVDAAQQLLERNQVLQQRLLQLEQAPASERLSAIQTAMDVAATPQRPGPLQSLAKEAGTAYAVAAVTGLLPGGVLGAVAAKLAPAATRKMTEWVLNRLAKASAESASRTSAALDTLLSGTGRAARVTPPAATRVLAAASFAPDGEETPRRAKLADAYHARQKEILSQVEAGPDGRPVMRRSARAAVARRLAGVAAVSPVLADRLETHAAKRIEYLADKLPKKPDLGAVQIGPEQPQHASDIQMRTFARIAAAVEDPGGVEERMALGRVVPDEVEAYRAVHPERHADLTRQIIERLPTLRHKLPFERRLALSIFTGVPMDPTLSPPIIRVMQSMYAAEPGTEGGTQPPQAQPQFGSVSREQPTPAQKRSEV